MEQIDKIFKDGLINYESTPKSMVWDSISQNINQNKKKRPLPIFWRVAAGIAFLLGLGLLFQKNNEINNTAESANLNEQTNIYQNNIVTSNNTYALNNTVPIDHYTYGLNKTKSYQKVKKQEISSLATKQSENNSFINNLINSESDREERMRKMNAIKSSKVYADLEEKPLFKNNITNKQVVDVEDYLNSVYSDEPEINTENKNNKISIGGRATPLYSYRDVVADNDSKSLAFFPKETGIVAYSGGINISYSPSGRFSFESGINYNRYGQETSDFKQMFESDNIYYNPDNENNFLMASSNIDSKQINKPMRDRDIPQAINTPVEPNIINNGIDISSIFPEKGAPESFAQYLDYIEIPLMMKYKIIDKKLDFSFIGGLCTNVLINKNFFFKFDDTKENVSEEQLGSYGYKNFSYSSAFGMEIGYPLLQNLILSIEPKFKYYLTSIDKNPNLDIFPYSIGIYAGVNYNF